MVCSGVSAVMWIANKEPEKDWSNIKKLIDHLRSVKAKRFVHISTVDVYPDPIDVTEDNIFSSEVNPRPYGKHRLKLEEEIRLIFKDSSILRLPALFGEGIKKNFVFDLIHTRLLDYIHPDSEFQYYNLRNIWYDILFALEHSIPTLNIATEPIKASIVAKRSLGIDIKPSPDAKKLTYSMKTKHDALRGTKDGYLYHASQVLPELIDFIQFQQSKLQKIAK